MRGAFYNLVNFINTTSINDVYANAARKILQNIYVIPGSTITDVAELCFVSTATISRLCRKLNYESFADFKMDITMNLIAIHSDYSLIISCPKGSIYIKVKKCLKLILIIF